MKINYLWLLIVLCSFNLNAEGLKLYTFSEDFNTNVGKYKRGQDAFLNIIIYNAENKQQRIFLPKQWSHLFGFFFMVNIEGSDSMVLPGGKISLIPDNYRYIILNPKEMFGIKINLSEIFPKLKPGKYKIKIQYNNQYGKDCFKGSIEAKNKLTIVIAEPDNKFEQGYISEEQAISIAKKAHHMKYDKTQPLKTSLDEGIYTVIFPNKLPPGAIGGDYAAKIKIDAKTGKVLQVLVGS